MYFRLSCKSQINKANHIQINVIIRQITEYETLQEWRTIWRTAIFLAITRYFFHSDTIFMLGTPQGTCLVTSEATCYASKSIVVVCIDD